jgi:hypothetical protein
VGELRQERMLGRAGTSLLIQNGSRRRCVRDAAIGQALHQRACRREGCHTLSTQSLSDDAAVSQLEVMETGRHARADSFECRLTDSEFCWRGPPGRKADNTTAYPPHQSNG